MAFCTECGSRLPDAADFCPNCGVSTKIHTATVKTDTVSGDDQRENVASCISDRGEYYSPAQASCTPPEQVNYGYPKPGVTGVNGQTVEILQKKSPKTAIIVICSVAAVVLLFTILFLSLRGGSSVVGYWETTDVRFEDQHLKELFGQEVGGLIKIQVNEDGSIYWKLYDGEILEEHWTQTHDGFASTMDGDIVEFEYDKGKLKLHLDDDSYYFIFERATGDIVKYNADVGDVAPTSMPVGPVGIGIAGSGDVENGAFHISVIGAEDFRDTDNNPAIRVYYEFTNNSEYSLAAYNVLDYEATQDAITVDNAYSMEDVEVYYNDTVNIRPGMTIQCCAQFLYDPSGSELEVSFYGDEGEKNNGEVLAAYIPGSLPGAPVPFVFDTVEKPQWTSALDSEGYINDGNCYVAVKKMELISDYYGDPAIRIYYEFTNNDVETTSMADSCYTYAYQDGYSLFDAYAEEDSVEDKNYKADIAPGKTILASCVFTLRNQASAVEAEVEEDDTYFTLGKTFKIK